MNNYQERLRIGQMIKQMRETSNLSLEDLAQKADITPSHLERIESGKYNLRLDQLGNITEALHKKIYIA